MRFCKIWTATILASSIWIAVPAHSSGQVVSDTLDWRQYYPLEIGNVWEWSTYIVVAYNGRDVVEIIGDTLIGGQHYYIQTHYADGHDPNSGPPFSRFDTEYVRYDTTAQSVVGLDTTTMELYDLTCDLSADFGGMSDCLSGRPIFSHGAYADSVRVGSEFAPSGASKTLHDVGTAFYYYHGVGRHAGVGDGAAGTVDFQYVNINGVEYGERFVITSAHHSKVPTDSDISIYPLPAKDFVVVNYPNFEFATAITVYDVTGKRVMTARCMESPCRLDTSRFPSGSFYLRLVSQRNSRSTTFLVAR